MPTIEDMTWDDMWKQLTFMAEDRSALRQDQKERVLARALLYIANLMDLRGPS